MCVYCDLSGDDDPEVTEIESFCVSCHKNGITRLLLTRIPHYKNVVIMSFSCEECGYENNEIQSGGAFAEMGVSCGTLREWSVIHLSLTRKDLRGLKATIRAYFRTERRVGTQEYED